MGEGRPSHREKSEEWEVPLASRELAVGKVAAGRPLGKRLEAALGQDWAAAWLFFLPTLLLLFALIGWPFVQGFYVGFTRTIGSTVTIGPWVGLENYLELLHDDAFWESLRITVTFTFWAEVFKPLLGVAAALLLHNIKRFRAVLSAAILLPWIVPSVVQALIWRALYDPIFGGINEILRVLHLSEAGATWLGDPSTALWAVIVVNVWAGIPFFTLTNLAGLKSIDPELYAAASADGANAWQRFRYVTLPGLRYTLIVSILLSTIWTMNNYGTIYLLTQGGPLSSTRVIGILTYERAFSATDFGSGVAISLILLPLFGLIIWILASYMQGGGEVGEEAPPLPLRVVGPILRPLGRLFNAIFDLGEALAGWLGASLGRLLRGSGGSVGGARAGRLALGGISGVVLSALLLFELLPFYWVIVSAFKGDEQIARMRSTFWPQPWTLGQFDRLLVESPFWTWYQNTLQVSLVAVAIGVLAAAMGAYALARLRWRGSGTLSGLMLVSYMMPNVVMLIPIYQIMVWLRLINTPWALELAYPSFLLPFATWLLMGYYRSIPEDLEDAARIDGASRLQIFTRIILPLSKPALFAVTLFALTSAWNEFFLAYILIRSSTYFTLSVGLAQMVFGDIYPIGRMMAASLLMAIPVVIVYGLAQKHMVEGLTVGSVKG